MMSTRSAFYHVVFFIWIISHVHMCPDVPKLRIVPGSGWDSLTNKDTKPVMQVTYNQCKLTNDGRALIPDNTFSVALNAQEIEVTSQIFDHWSNYTPPTSAGFKVATDVWTEQFLPLYYSFSDEYQEIKKLQVSIETFTCRSQLRQIIYRINSTSDATIGEAFSERVLQVLTAFDRNDTDRARYFVETIVRDYGTHYSKNVDVGAVLVKEDYVKDVFLATHGNDRSKIVSASKLSLLDYTGFSWKHKHDLDSSLSSEYNAAVLEKKIRFFGGLNWNEGAVSDYLVAIDKSGDLLSNLITSSNFPSASGSLLTRARLMFTDVIRDYYERNIHRGCTRPKWSNFEFAANLDDGSCTYISDYYFGGVYATCSQHTYQQTDICRVAILNNPLTTTTSCPTNFGTSIVYSRVYMKVAEAFIHSYKQHIFFSCMAKRSIGKSYLFGGLYSPYVNNVHTMRKSCPPFYTAISAHAQLGSLSICVNNTDGDSAKRYALPFGGFASSTNEYQCPIGYKKRLAMKFNAAVPDDAGTYSFKYAFGSDENIYYCLHEPPKNTEEVASLIRPPFQSATDC